MKWLIKLISLIQDRFFYDFRERNILCCCRSWLLFRRSLNGELREILQHP
jgi:hypothetical protein